MSHSELDVDVACVHVRGQSVRSAGWAEAGRFVHVVVRACGVYKFIYTYIYIYIYKQRVSGFLLKFESQIEFGLRLVIRSQYLEN